MNTACKRDGSFSGRDVVLGKAKVGNGITGVMAGKAQCESAERSRNVIWESLQRKSGVVGTPFRAVGAASGYGVLRLRTSFASEGSTSLRMTRFVEGMHRAGVGGDVSSPISGSDEGDFLRKAALFAKLARERD